MGGGLLGAVATISTIRYWAAGFAGGGDSGFAALEGLTRTVGAALFLAIWPWLFDTAVQSHEPVHRLAARVRRGRPQRLASARGRARRGRRTRASRRSACSEHRDRRRREPAVPRAAAAEDRGQHLDHPGVHRDAAGGRARGRWCRGSRERRCARSRSACSCPCCGRCVSPARRRGEPNAISFSAAGVAERAARAAGRDRAAVGDAPAADRISRKVAMLGAAPLGGGFVSRAVSYAAGSQIRDTARQHLPAWAGGQRHLEQRADCAEPEPHWAPGCGKPRRSRARPPPAAQRAPQPPAAERAPGPPLAGRPGRPPAGSGAGGNGALRTRRRRRAQANAADMPAERAADPELSRAGLRQREFEARFRERDEPGVGRAGHGGARRPCRPTPSAGSASWSPSTARGARASRLPGDRRMDIRAARSAAHARRRQP